MTEHQESYLIYKPQYLVSPEYSKWTCYLFGNRPGGMGMTYTPQKGQVPNRFVRFMMRIFFDCYWVKKDDL